MRRLGVPESLACHLDLHRQSLVRVETRWHGEQMLQASQQKSGRDEQHQCERHLNHDKRASRQLMAARDAHRLLRRAAWHGRTEAVECGQEADEQADHRRQSRGEGKHRPVDDDCAAAGQLGRAERHQRVHRRVRENDSKGAADCREQQRFGKQLADDPRP